MTTWVLLAGLPGTGKSTLAHALEGRLGVSRRVAILDKDRIRAAIFPGSLTDYTREQDDLCVRSMVEAAAYLTTRGRVDFVLFDGRTFSHREQIQEVVAAAERAGAPWRILHLVCPDEIAEARLGQTDLAHPDRPSHPAQNRDAALYRQLKREFEPIAFAKLEVDTTHGIEAGMEAVCRYLLEMPDAGLAMAERATLA